MEIAKRLVMRRLNSAMARQLLVVGAFGGGALAGVHARADEPAVPAAKKADRSSKSAPRTITLTFENLASDEGRVRCRIFNRAEGFPMNGDRAIDIALCRPAHGRADCTFIDLPPGVYAAACFHDADDNADLGTNFLGIPSEGVAASNNASATFGPPRWKDAKFVYDGRSLRQVLTMDY